MLIFVDTPTGVEIRDRDTALAQVRQSLRQAPSLSRELIADRQAEAAHDLETP